MGVVRMLPVIIVDYAIKCPGGTVYFEVRLPAGRGGEQKNAVHTQMLTLNTDPTHTFCSQQNILL